VKVAIVLRWAPTSIKAMLRAHVQNIGADYGMLRNLVVAYVTSGYEYDASGMRAGKHGDDGGRRAMEVGAVTGSCNICGKPGHYAKDCWHAKGGSGKGAGKGYGGNGGKGGKGKSGGGKGFGGKDAGGKPSGKGSGGKGDWGQRQQPYGGKGGGGGGGKQPYFEGYCGFCQLYGHRRADCRKRIAAQESGKVAAVAAQEATAEQLKAAAAPAEPPKFVRSVTYEADLVVPPPFICGTCDISSGPSSRPDVGWIMGVAAESEDLVGSPILLDSGSDEHMCPTHWHRDADTLGPGPGGQLRDVQGGVIEDQGRRWVTMDLPSADGNDAPVVASSCFTVGNVSEPIISVGKLVRSGGQCHFGGPLGSYVELGGRRIPVELVGNRFKILPSRTVAMASREVAPIEGQFSSSSAGPADNEQAIEVEDDGAMDAGAAPASS